MTSQLNVDTIVDKAGSGGTNVKIGNTSVTVAEGGSATTTTVQGLCKVWGKFDGTAGSVAYSDSFNTSGLTDLGTGEFQFLFSNNMANDDYATMCNCTFYSGVTGGSDSPTTAAVKMFTANASATLTDRDETCISISGDLA